MSAIRLSQDLGLNSAYAEQIILDLIENEEGGWVASDSPYDPDIGTYAGVRLETARKYFQNPGMTLEQFSQMPKGQIVRLYYDEYYVKGNVDGVIKASQNTGLARAYFSFGVNSGFDDAGAALQRAIIRCAKPVQLKIDGVIGPKSCEALTIACMKVSPWTVQKIFVIEWQMFIADLVMKNTDAFITGKTTLKRYKNLAGWINRTTRHLP